MPDEVFYDLADLWAMQLWELQGWVSNGPLQNESWWQEWQRVRTFIEEKATARCRVS